MVDQSKNHLLLQLKKLEKSGYTDQLKFIDGKIKDLDHKTSYSAGQVVRMDEYRFEGMSNPDDMSILFALEFEDGRKGTLVAAYGPMGDADLFTFMKEIKP